MPFLSNLEVGGLNVTTLTQPLKIVVPLNAYNTSRDNAARMNVAKYLQGMSVVQLNAFLLELKSLLLIDTEWPICIYNCGTRSLITMVASEIAQMISGEIELRKNVATATTTPTVTAKPATPTTTPPATVAQGISWNQVLFFGGGAVALYLLLNQFQGGTTRA